MKYRGYFFDKEGNEISLEAYCDLIMLGPRYGLIKKTNLSGLRINTWWMGANMAPKGETPLIFRTNIDGVPSLKYSTKEQAILGHNFLVVMHGGYFCDGTDNFVR